MKWVAGVLIGTILCLCSLSFVVADWQIKQMEDRLHYCVGLVSDKKDFGFSEEKEEDRSACDTQENVAVFAENALEEPSRVWQRGGRYSQSFEQEDQEIYSLIRSKYPEIEEEDWSPFGTMRLEILPQDPLDDEELAYLCKKIVGCCSSSVPVTGNLEKITFVNEEKRYVFARICLCLKGFSEVAHLSVLPDYVVFSVTIPIELKNAEKSVDCKNITVNCETMDIPEILLTYGSYVLFGQKDYKALLGGIFANILYNAGICG